jgi:hypothetical protein
MRILIFSTLLMILLLGGCSKNNNAVNFACLVSGTSVSGNAITFYNPASIPSTFQVTMNGPSNSSVTIVWYNISSIAAVSHLTGTYTMPSHPLPPLVAGATYVSQYGYSQYNTGVGNNLSGSVTITKNTGPGGVISGTFYFNALNGNNTADTAHVTQGTFADVPVVMN